MAAKTSVFYLTERVSLDTAGTAVSDTIDLGAYVDVADRQGILIHDVDFITQARATATDSLTTLATALGGNTDVQFQLTDLNRGEMVFADDRALVASGVLHFGDTNNTADHSSDLYPDNFGPTSAQGGRIVINDQMYLRAVSSRTAVSGNTIEVIVRIKCSVISLSQKDFMAIALQSTAADN